MWVSRSEWEELNKRVRELEITSRFCVVDPTDTKMRMVVRDCIISYAPARHVEVPVWHAVNYIMKHLGLKFEYVSGEPEKKASWNISKTETKKSK